MTLRTENKSMILNFAYHINLSRWTQENSTNIVFIDDHNKGLIMNRKYNKSMLVFTNQSALDLYELNNQSNYLLNATLLEKYHDIDLYAIEMPDIVEHQFDFQNVSANNTIFLMTEEILKLQKFIEEVGDVEIITQFRQIQYLNCDKIGFYLPQLAFFCGLYLTCFAYLCAKIFRTRGGYSPNVVQRFIPILPLLKLIYCILNYSYWLNCPWVENNEGVNFIRSFKVTLATLFQTMLCLLFIVCALGFRISRERLAQQDIKKMLVITSSQYFVDSIYSLGSYIEFIKIPVTLILNAFSVFMIIFVLYETKRNFDGLNLRMFIINNQPQLRYISQAITRKKRYISILSLSIIFYFTVEISIHGIWDFSSIQKTIYDQLNIWLFHEIVDFAIVMIIGLVVNHVSQSRLQAGESIIDISNIEFRDDINRMKQVFMYQCQIDEQIDNQQYEDDKDLNTLEIDTPIIIVQPGEEHCCDIKIAYRDTKEINASCLVQVAPSLDESQYVSNMTMASERNELVHNRDYDNV